MYTRSLLLALASLVVFVTVTTAQVDTGWVRTFDPAGADVPMAIVVSPAGNVTAGGNSGSFSIDFALATFGPNGDSLWATVFNGLDAALASEWFEAMATDTGGNVYVTGSSLDTAGALRIATIKYESNGDLAWQDFFEAGGYVDGPQDMAVGDDGSVYVVGQSAAAIAAEDDWIVIKYTAAGDTAWTRRYSSPGDLPDRAYSVTLDGNRNVYVAGFVSAGDANDWDVVVRKYTASGDSVWTQTWAGSGKTKETPVKIVYDKSGYVYVVCYRAEGSTHVRNLILKYDLAGNKIWEKEYGDYLQYNYSPESAQVDESGNLIFYGRRSPAGSVTYVYKLNTSGDSLWLKESNRLTYNMQVDRSGDMYLVGQAAASGSGPGSVTITKYSANGDSVWNAQYIAPNGAVTSGLTATVDSAKNLYVAGTKTDTGSTDANFLVIKYVQVPTDVPNDGGPASLPYQYLLKQNYPNPFNPETQIEFTLPKASKVRLEIVNMLGERVKTLLDQLLPAGTHRMTWYGDDTAGRELASGMYLYRLQADGFVETKKMVLMK